MVTRNIVILPPSDIAKQAIVWSQHVAEKYPTNFILDGNHFYPHITLYQAAYPEKNIQTVKEQLLLLVKEMSPFSVYTDQCSALAGFVFLNLVKSEQLVSLHKHIVRVCNPLREGLMLDDPKKYKEKSMRESMENYGSLLDWDAYMPHITISRLQQFQHAPDTLSLFEKVNISFDVHAIYLANIGPDGSVNEIIQEFPFAS